MGHIDAMNGRVIGSASTDVAAGVLAQMFLDDSATGPMTMKLPERKTLFWEEDLVEDLYEVESGLVCAFKVLSDGRRHIPRFFRKGDLIGLSLSDRHTYSAETLTPVTLTRVRRSELKSRMASHPEVAHSVLDLAFEELQEARNQMLLLGRKSASERVASFLLAMAEPLRVQEDDGDLSLIALLPMARADIADYLGLTLETVCRAISQMKRKGVIRQLRGHRIQIIDREGLADIAEGLG